MKAAELSVHEFRAKVVHHLKGALSAIPSKVPEDVVTDPVADQMMRHLNALDELLYGLGSEQRDQEHSERNRVLRIEAKRKNPNLEELVMKIDRRVQHAVVVLGSSAACVIAPMDADLCASAFVDFLDAFPAEAFAVTRSIPPGFPSARDITVATLIAAIRIRKEQQQ